MTVQRDPDAILAAWLEEGPTGLPEPSRRAIAVEHPNHRPSDGVRSGCRGGNPSMNTYARSGRRCSRDRHRGRRRCIPSCAWRQPGRRSAGANRRTDSHTRLRPGRPRRPHRPRQLGHRRARPSSPTKASSIRVRTSLGSTRHWRSRSIVRSSTTAPRTSSVAAASMPTCPDGSTSNSACPGSK